MGFYVVGTVYYNFFLLFKNRERVFVKGYISDQLIDEVIGVVDRVKIFDQFFMFYLVYNVSYLLNDNFVSD